MKTMKLFTVLLAMSAVACSNENKKLLSNLPDGLYTIIKTSKGTLVVELYYEKAPITVINFAGLAMGAFADNISRKGNYYDGLTFHRVVDDFVVQGGDPAGNGTGGPGYTFVDEFDDSLSFTSAGILAMANSGPATNGSQFFITLNETSWLNQKHTIFGKVVTNDSLVSEIVEGDTMTSVTVEAKGTNAETFLKTVTWENFETLRKEKQAESDAEQQNNRADIEKQIKKESPTLEKNSDGIYVHVEKEGEGTTIQSNQTAVVHYKLQLYGSSEIIDSSFARNEPIEVPVGQGRVIKGWELMLLQMKKGSTVRAIIPPELGYGEAGAGGVIPPNAFLDFQMELVDIK